MNLFEVLLLALNLLSLAGLIALWRHNVSLSRTWREDLRQSRLDTENALDRRISALEHSLTAAQKQVFESHDRRLSELAALLSQSQSRLQQTVSETLTRLDAQMAATSQNSKQSMEELRTAVELKLRYLQTDNSQKLELIRATVDERLQKSLEERVSQSFQLVSQRLEDVYKGLGEMQALAAGVGDLKRVLSNVKTRGILGEIQLGAILEQILSPEQYETNAAVNPHSAARVEFAVRLPGEEHPVYLPIDAKFPLDTYEKLLTAYDAGDAAQVEAAANLLKTALRGFAKDIHDKYIVPPYTTDFAILFLPVEGLYAEAVRRGAADLLQREYKISLAGPTTLAALLNALQMGFQTLAVQKRSGEVWQILGAVKTEFEKFSQVLTQTQNRLQQAGDELDKLVGVRTRAIQRRLKAVSTLEEAESLPLIEEEDPF